MTPVARVAFGTCRADTAAATAPAPAPAPIAIRAGRLIDVVAGRTFTDQVILVRGTKIEAAGADVRIPPGRPSRRSVRHDGASRPRRLPHASCRPGECRTVGSVAQNGCTDGLIDGHPECAGHLARRVHHGARRRRVSRLQRRRHARCHREGHHHRAAHVRRRRLHHDQRGRRRDDRALARRAASWDMQFGVANSPWEVRQKESASSPTAARITSKCCPRARC